MLLLDEPKGSAGNFPPGTATAKSHVSGDKRFKTRLSEVAGCSDECQDKARVQLCCSLEELTMRSPAQIKTGTDSSDTDLGGQRCVHVRPLRL